MDLSEFVNKYMTLSGIIKWCDQKQSLTPIGDFNMPKQAGVYTMVEGIDVIKHGSSKDLWRRWNKEYLNHTYYNSPDRIARDRQVRAYRSYFIGNNKGTLSVFYLASEIETTDPIFNEPTIATLKNFYENKLTDLASKSNHSLALMKQRKS